LGCSGFMGMLAASRLLGKKNSNISQIL